MRSALALVMIMIALGAAAFGSPFSALVSYLWYAFFRPQDWVWIDITSYGLSMILGGALILRSVFAGIAPNVTHPISIGILLFAGTGLLAQVNAVAPDVGWNWVDYFFRLTLVCLFLIALVDTPRKLFVAVLTVAGCLGFHAAKAGYGSMVFGGGAIVEGLGGSFPDNNGFALAAAMIFPMLIALSQCVPADWPARAAIRNVLRLTAAGCVLAVIGTFSRGGLLGLVTGLVFLVAVQKGQQLKLIVALVGAVVVAVIFVDLPEGYKDRVETIATYNETGEASALSRLHFWRVAIDMVVDHPFGVGMFNFPYAYDQYDFLDGLFGRSRPVHSSHFQVLAEQGFAGFFVWALLFYSAFVACLRARREATLHLGNTPDGQAIRALSTGLFGSMGAFVVGGAFGNLSLNDLTWVTFAMVAALDRVRASLIQAPPQKTPTDLTLRDKLKPVSANEKA
jgi:putative inorganic carbon (HCO3(-)) transporter